MVFGQKPRFQRGAVGQVIHLWLARRNPMLIASTFCITLILPYLLLFDGVRFAARSIRIARGRPCFAAAVFAAVLLPPCRALVADVVVAAFRLRDLIYATSEFNCSSVTCPLKVGMIGWKPSTTCDAGFRIELRIYSSSALTVCAADKFNVRAEDVLELRAALAAARPRGTKHSRACSQTDPCPASTGVWPETLPLSQLSKSRCSIT